MADLWVHLPGDLKPADALIFAAHRLGLDWAFSGMRYGKKWKSYRRLFHEYMGPGPIKGYEDALCKAADSLLVRLKKDPEHYREHTKLSVALVILGA